MENGRWVGGGNRRALSLISGLIMPPNGVLVLGHCRVRWGGTQGHDNLKKGQMRGQDNPKNSSEHGHDNLQKGLKRQVVTMGTLTRSVTVPER